MNEDVSIAAATDIAVVGFAARFPGAENAGQFWDNLRQGVESIRAFSVQELASVGVSSAALGDPDYVRVGAPLSGLDAFDAGFFGFSPREAAIMDPQQRFFLESAWEALEHAGYAPGTFAGSTGVFAGSGPNSYLFHNLLSDPELVAREGIFLLRHTGNDKDVLATRLSYQMNLRGPSLNVQTACSTSLVAVHLACQSLLHLDCDMALAGAVSIEIPHAIGYHYRQNEIQSHDGHCRSFDANATGTVFGSGLGIVVLKRLPEALAAGDTIHAVIKGTAVNNDGSRKVGFLAPSTEGQVEVIQEALGAAGVEPASIDYIETHGTGTPIGDPIELSALEQVFSRRDRRLRIGSVKTNIGHLDTAAGMAGLLKTVLALKHRQIPATLHFKALNPLIDANKTKLEVVDCLTEWTTNANAPRRAGVTSLGIGGTNAHVILEEPPASSPSVSSRPVRLFTLSAKSPAALDDATRALSRHPQRHPGENLDDAAYTLHVGRAGLAHRRAIVARDHAEAVQRTEQPETGSVTAQVSDLRPVAFLFTGQGAQHVHMGAELYQAEPIFRKWIDYSAERAVPHLGFDFREILYPAKENEARAAEQMKLTWNAQPILFAFEYALAQLWLSWGIRPEKLIGHSLGEYSAACVGGVFTLDDGIALVCARGALMKKVAEGAMLAVSRAEADVAPWIEGGLSLAAVNGPRQCVISGPVAAIAGLHEKLTAQSIPAQRLETGHAFHSASLDPVLDAFVEIVGGVRLRAPRIPIISNVTGARLTDGEATSPAYWARHFRGTVRFYEGLKLLQAEPTTLLLEVGPGEILSALARQSGTKEMRARVVPSLNRTRAKTGELASVLSALGALWVHGVKVDWDAFHAGEKLHRIPLPTYSFQRKRAWLGPKIGTNWLADSLARVDEWFYRASWKPAELLPAPAPTGFWLVLDDATLAAQKLVELMHARKAAVIRVTAGDKFASPTEDSYIVNPASVRDIAHLFDYLIRRGQIPRHIVHLWGLKPATGAEERCFHSLVQFIQALGVRLPDQSVAITAVTHRSVSIHREPVLHPHGALLSGPCRVAPLEYPVLRCRQVDVDSTEPADLAALILREGESESGEALAVYREGARWGQGVERIHLEAAKDRVREKGTYLITGGLGGLGMAVADWLARAYHARLVLLSRRNDVAQEKIFAQWRELGAEVLVLAADVTDRESLRPALAQAREKFGPLNGIVHAAGILNDGIIQLKKKETAHHVLAPKTVGVEVLDELTRDQPLDFFALFSSISALTPPDGQVDYCAANAFLHAFAQSQPAARNFIVIGWGRWSQAGMAALQPAPVAGPAPFQHPLLDRVELDTAARTIYSGTLSVEKNWVLGEHHFHDGDSLLPGTAHLEIAITALWKKIGRQPVTLENIVFLAPLRVAPESPCVIHAELRKAGEAYQFSVTANDVAYVSGLCRPTPAKTPRIEPRQIARRCPVEKKDAPRNVRQRGHFDFGPRWGSLREIAFGDNECLGLLELPAEYRAETRQYAFHPALMDIASGVAMYMIPGYDQPGDLLLPFAYKRMAVYSTLPARVYSHVRMRHGAGSDLIVFDVTLASVTGEVVAEIEEFTVKRLRSVADLSQLVPLPVAAAGAVAIASEKQAGIGTREGLEAFQRILKSRAADMIYVSPKALTLAASNRDGARLADSVTASADDVNLVVEQLWQGLLGLEQVDARTDFFDSGGNSLLAIRLFADIRKRFNVNFGLSVLFEARTAGALADLIRKARVPDAAPALMAANNTFVPVRPGDSKTPLFLIHDVNGDVIRYEHLARHFPDGQAVYAIEPLGLRGKTPDFTVRGMARHYVEQIRERQPKGPYFVAGHSFGGLIAYEIACQFAALGETMGVVGLFDTYQENVADGDELLQESHYRREASTHLKNWSRHLWKLIVGKDRIGYWGERKNALQFRINAKLTRYRYRLAYKLHTRFGWAIPPSMNNVREANWIASDHYRPPDYPGTVVLFRCKDRIRTDPPDSSRLWQRLVKGELAILEAPGDHNSILHEPGAGVLAGHLLGYLKNHAVDTTEK
jgi:acyl transferase domain-containing protein/thioesterase domain-containing protein/acyl carrier protein